MKEQMEHRQKGGRRGGALVLARWPWPIVRNVAPAVCVRRNHNNRAKPAERHFCSFVWFAPRLSNFGAFAEKSPMPWLHDSMALGLRGSTLGSWVRGRRVRRLVSGLETSEGQTPEAHARCNRRGRRRPLAASHPCAHPYSSDMLVHVSECGTALKFGLDSAVPS